MCVREIREKGVRAPLALIRGGFSTTLTLCRRSESRGMCRLTRGTENALHTTEKKMPDCQQSALSGNKAENYLNNKLI